MFASPSYLRFYMLPKPFKLVATRGFVQARVILPCQEKLTDAHLTPTERSRLTALFSAGHQSGVSSARFSFGAPKSHMLVMPSLRGHKGPMLCPRLYMHLIDQLFAQTLSECLSYSAGTRAVQRAVQRTRLSTQNRTSRTWADASRCATCVSLVLVQLAALDRHRHI